MKKVRPEKAGLYRSAFEHDNCGIGFVAHLKGKKSHHIIQRGLETLVNMTHRGAEGADSKTGDGAGVGAFIIGVRRLCKHHRGGNKQYLDG